MLLTIFLAVVFCAAITLLLISAVAFVQYDGTNKWFFSSAPKEVVTAQDIKRAFDEVRGKDTGRGYIYMLLERHGWRKVMPRSKHPKAANEEACEVSKKLKPVCWKPEKTCSRTRQDV